MSGAAPTEQRLLFAILQHLQARPGFVADAAAWDAAVQALERVSGMTVSSAADRQRYGLRARGAGG